mgnify:CR=1 FL=1
MGNMIKVGMADLKACKCPDALTTLGLGSCVGVALYDPVTKIGGLLHCMLPDSTQFRNNSNIAKFYNLFEVQDGPDAQKDILNFVFNMQECDDYNNLLEDTSLQRLLKKQLLENKSIKIGWGKLKKELL